MYYLIIFLQPTLKGQQYKFFKVNCPKWVGKLLTDAVRVINNTSGQGLFPVSLRMASHILFPCQLKHFLCTLFKHLYCSLPPADYKHFKDKAYNDSRIVKSEAMCDSVGLVTEYREPVLFCRSTAFQVGSRVPGT